MERIEFLVAIKINFCRGPRMEVIEVLAIAAIAMNYGRQRSICSPSMAIQVEFLNQQLLYVRILSAEALATAATTIPILLMFSILPRTLPRATHGAHVAWKVKARDG